VWQRRISVGLMALHIVAFAAFWLYLGRTQVMQDILVGMVEQRPSGNEMEILKSVLAEQTSALCTLWFWIPIFLLHTALFLRKRNAIKRKNDFLNELGGERRVE
jgi:hypothetical protein